jgi:hypothetical protein
MINGGFKMSTGISIVIFEMEGRDCLNRNMGESSMTLREQRTTRSRDFSAALVTSFSKI